MTNFAGQWLYLRNLDAVSPDPRTFPEFDDNLRQAFRRETELLFESVVKEDRNVLDLLRAPYVRQRAARAPLRHSERLRQPVPPRPLSEDSVRAGLLGHGSVLTVTSCEPDLAGASRQVGAGEHPRHSPATTAAQRAAARHAACRQGALNARADDTAPFESGVLRLPSVDGSSGALDGELRRHRPLADAHGSRLAGRCVRGPAGRRRSKA